jgi:hypothetical protein
MTVSITCKRCKQPIIAEDEDDLIAQVEAHARDHGGAHGTHIPTRRHVLAHLQRQDRKPGT